MKPSLVPTSACQHRLTLQQGRETFGKPDPRSGQDEDRTQFWLDLVIQVTSWPVLSASRSLKNVCQSDIWVYLWVALLPVSVLAVLFH